MPHIMLYVDNENMNKQWQQEMRCQTKVLGYTENVNSDDKMGDISFLSFGIKIIIEQ